MTNRLNSINGSVQSQGIKVNYKNWLDLSTKEWKETPDKVKAAAYQAAKLCGWKDEGLKTAIMSLPHIDQFIADATIETLKVLADKFPLPTEPVYDVKDK